MIRHFLFFILTGWRAVESFGCPAPYKPVKCRFDIPVIGKTKTITGYYMPETNRFVYKTQTGKICMSKRIFKTSNIFYEHRADAFSLMEGGGTVLYWKYDD